MYRANMKEFYVKAWTGVLPVCLFVCLFVFNYVWCFRVKANIRN